jgi:hypothetical protein
VDCTSGFAQDEEHIAVVDVVDHSKGFAKISD